MAMVTRALTLYSAKKEYQFSVLGDISQIAGTLFNNGMLFDLDTIDVVFLPPLDPVLYSLGVTP